LILVDGLHFKRRKPDLALAVGTTADEAASLPPSLDQGLRDPLRVTVKLELEVDPLHLMAAAWMWAGRFVVMNVRRRHGAESTFAVETIEGFQLGR
jgi:hypothetical protein